MKLNGDGKYNQTCTMIRQMTAAKGVLVMVVDGSLGSGVSIQGDKQSMDAIADTLEIIAKQMRKDIDG